MSDYILELKDVVKTFGGVRALNGVKFQLKKGEIHALMGENGAGKSTFIKVITGVRRAGKSKLLELFKEYINNNVDNANIIHINYNKKEFDNLLTGDELYNYITNKYIKNKENFVLIDEIQKCKGFEDAINSVHAEEKYNIYITVSNAFLLSSDLATLFTGRTFKIDVYPFSFKEYNLYFNYDNPYLSINSYIKDGGMAGSYLYDNKEDKNAYLKDIY